VLSPEALLKSSVQVSRLFANRYTNSGYKQ